MIIKMKRLISVIAGNVGYISTNIEKSMGIERFGG